MNYTTTTDSNGNFTISLESALTSGEVVQITAQKDGQSKSISIQAPSEPYLPPENSGSSNKLTFPMNSMYAQILLMGLSLIYNGNGCTQTSVDNTHTLTNQYFKKNETIHVVFIHKIPIEEFKAAQNTDQFLKYRQGVLQPDGSITYDTSGVWYTKQEILEYSSSQCRFIIDNDYLYVLFNTSINYVADVGDGGSEYAYQITYADTEHLYKLNKSYIESEQI